jgi:hypothetical protein
MRLLVVAMTIRMAALCSLLVLFSASASPQVAATAAIENPEEYAVWSAVLNYAYPAEATHQLVIEDATVVLPDLNFSGNGVYRHPSYSVFEIIADISHRPYSLERKFELRLPYALISKTEAPPISLALPGGRDTRDDIAKMRSSWKGFYKKYPGAHGILALSRVAFVNHGAQAVVYVTNEMGPSDSRDWDYSLARENGTWVVKSVERIPSG